MTEENVKVAVRVRPFNQREKDANSKLIIAMNQNQTSITNLKTNEEKKFAFDYSYWSHDGFKVDDTGYMYSESENSKYVDQKKVFDDLGSGILKNSWNGYNASLFAYGQTGSGKSYSVVGYGKNRGIVPLVCEEIFQNSKSINKDTVVEVTFSMLEIYSEIVRDLLNSKSDRKNSLAVREDPKTGFYPQGLQRILVGSYNEIAKLMDEGSANRTIASTNMNATSSRAHTIVTVKLVQKYKNNTGKEMSKTSIINLVDLAGSERADQTGATGDRLKEGAAINLSLTSLGNVIAALSENANGKNVRVPYRDSVLTKLLMNALGGNSKTIMVAAISPADINYDESLSTLRYADRAKQIKTKAIINEDPVEKLINDLKAENARLKQMLESGKIANQSMNTVINEKPEQKNNDTANETNQAVEANELLKKQLEENEKTMKAMQQSYEEKLAEAQNQTANLSITKIMEGSKKIPHLRNVNMDPSLSGTIRYLIDRDDSITIGTLGNADINLTGLGILDKHARILKENEKYYIIGEEGAKVLKNGLQLNEKTELNHLDRLLFGTLHYYIFIIPSRENQNDVCYTFEMMQEEIAKASGLITEDLKNMTQEEIQCQAELIDLVPAIEEANMISIFFDKKVIFTALPVSAEARGEYDGKMKPYVIVNNFLMGLEWIWPKNKFLDRKYEMNEMYLDFMDDGVINTEKYMRYDPFYESPDVPTQIGAAMIFPKSFANMVGTKADYQIINMKSKEAGFLNVEILPCNSKGEIISDASMLPPINDLLNKTLNFIIKINEVKNLDSRYEDVFCQFRVFNDPSYYRTQTIKGDKGFNFDFSKMFSFKATEEFLEHLLNKTLYIQIWSEQKHTKPDYSMAIISTHEYYENQKKINNNKPIIGKEIINNLIDPEKQKLKEELNASLFKNKTYDFTIKSINNLIVAYGTRPIPGNVVGAILTAKNDEQVKNIINNSLVIQNNMSFPTNSISYPSGYSHQMYSTPHNSRSVYTSDPVQNSVACNLL